MRFSRIVLPLCFAACSPAADTPDVPSSVLVEPPAEYADAVGQVRESVIGAIARRERPGLSITVAIGGEIVWAEGFGWADLGRRDPVTPETRFRVGSFTQAFTGAAAGRLRDRGLLDLDAPIRDYLETFPEKRWPVTTRQLMGHVAGVRTPRGREWMPTEACAALAEGLETFASDSLRDEPGERYRYTVHDYTLVGAVLEAVAGEPITAVLDREVFAPLGMRETIPSGAESDGAAPYELRAFRTFARSPTVDHSCQRPSVGYLSTPMDMARFGMAMIDGGFLERETTDLLWTPVRLGSGSSLRSGLGWNVRRVRFDDDAPASPMVYAEGWTPGGRGALMVYPEQRMVVAVASNIASPSLSGFAASVAEDLYVPPTQ